MVGERKKLIALLVISNVSLFGAGLYFGLYFGPPSSNYDSTIRVYKMEMEIVPEGFPIYGPNYVELNGTFETDDGISGFCPSENIRWNRDVFNITIHPSAIATHFGGEINITTGEGIWYSDGWLIIIRN